MGICFGACFGIAGCAAVPIRPDAETTARRVDAPAANSAQTSALAKAAEHWERRVERAELEAAIAAWHEASQTEGTQTPATLTQLAHAHYLMGQSILAFAWADRSEAARHFALGAEAATAALTSAAPGAEPGERAYWLAANWYAAAQLSGMTELVMREAAVRNLLERAIELAPEVDHGGAFRVLAEIHAHPAHPALRDLGKARAELDRALAIAPADLRNVLAYVEHYALPAQDAAIANARIAEALAANAASAEDRLAQTRAKVLAAEIDGRLE